jgi:type I restriction-modification system DNA methylase subunit
MSKDLIKSKKRVKELGEVYTPISLINEMLNKLPIEQWTEAKTFLEPSCGNGNFLVEILKKKVQTTGNILEALNLIYGIDIMDDNITESKKRLFQTAIELGLNDTDMISAQQIIDRNIIVGNALNIDFNKIWN